LKSRLQKLDGLKYENLKENIQKVISEIPKEKYVQKNKTRKVKKNYK
jgi:hypothetical protein